MLRQLIAERVLARPNRSWRLVHTRLITTFARRIVALLRSEPVDLPLRQPQALRGRLNRVHARQALRLERGDSSSGSASPLPAGAGPITKVISPFTESRALKMA